jgi:hypothetical protein
MPAARSSFEVPPRIKRMVVTDDILWQDIPGCGLDKDLGRRLVDSAIMLPVWNELISTWGDDSPLLDEFFETCLRLRKDWARDSQQTRSELKELMSETVDAANALANKLEAHRRALLDGCGHIPDTWDLMRETLIAAGDQYRPFADELQRLGWKVAEQVDGHSRIPPSFPTLLRGLATSMSAGPNDELDIRPTRIRAANAERTYCCRALARFFMRTNRGCPFQIIADTVSTMLDSADDPLSGNHVRELVADLCNQGFGE